MKSVCQRDVHAVHHCQETSTSQMPSRTGWIKGMCTVCTAEQHPVIKRANSANVNESRRPRKRNTPQFPHLCSLKLLMLEEPKLVVTRPGQRGRGRRWWREIAQWVRRRAKLSTGVLLNHGVTWLTLFQGSFEVAERVSFDVFTTKKC